MLSRRTAAGAGGDTLLRCEVGGETFCLDAARVAGIERADRVEPDPGDDGRVGWLTAAGARAPVHSLAALLGLPPAAPGPVAVVGGPGERWGLMVERVARLTTGPDAVRLPLPDAVAAAAGGRFAGAVRLGDRLALLLAPEHLRGGAAGAETAPELEPAEPPSEDSRRAGRVSPPLSGGALVLFSAEGNGRAAASLFGLSLAQIEEVLRPLPLTPVPGAGGNLLGVVPWRNRAVPVIGLGGDGHDAGGNGRSGRLLVARGVRRPGWVAFPVRADLRVEPLPLPNRAWTDGPRSAPLAALGVFEVAAGTVVVPDVDRILTPDRAAPAAPDRGQVGSARERRER